jgi:hypothetical protein
MSEQLLSDESENQLGTVLFSIPGSFFYSRMPCVYCSQGVIGTFDKVGIRNIIERETGPIRHKKAFVEILINNDPRLAKAMPLARNSNCQNLSAEFLRHGS